jgi:Helicase conserved C-terminal domain
VLDLAGSDGDIADMVPGSDIEGPGDEGRLRPRLIALAREAKVLEGTLDLKLAKGTAIVRKLLDDGFNPLIFCRFIATAEYVARELRKELPSDVQIGTVTGLLSAPEREQRIAEIDGSHKRVLVATDCLSEGVNLQHLFDAVLHYDLSWNPTRHEQREGRVDRYGQLSGTVRTITFYGTDNRIDGIVLQVLLRKHQRIKKATGVSVPVPGDPNTVVEAILEGLMLRKDPDPEFEQLVLLEGELAPKEKELLQEWDRSADRERRSRTMFAQEGIKVEEVTRELEAVRAAIGSGVDVRRFVMSAVPEFGGQVSGNGTVKLRLDGARTELREAMGTEQDHLLVTFGDPIPSGVLKLTRVHPAVSGLADLVLTTALDPLLDGPASRAGVVRTRSVTKRTTLLLLRHRHQLLTSAQSTGSDALLAEECDTVAFRGDPANPEWLPDADVDALLLAEPSANVDAEEQRHFARQAIAAVAVVGAGLDARAHMRASALQDAHGRARQATDQSHRGVTVAPLLPSDILGVYVYLPDLRSPV